jgi:hypothetical protein
MDNDTLLLVVGVCGLVGVIVLLAALLTLKIVRGSIFGFANLIVKMLTEPKEDDEKEDDEKEAAAPAAQAHRARPGAGYDLDDLRARAEAVDFDAAVKRLRETEAAAGAATAHPPVSPETKDRPDA